jgi:ATP-dependent Clp protease ATP-binding subunit ClpC
MTDGARNVVVLALHEALGLGHDSIGPEHLLLGLIREEEGIAARVLKSRNVREDDVRSRVRRMVDPGAGWTTARLPFAAQGKSVLELAVHEALTFRRKRVDTEHILLALLRNGESVAARILADLGAPPRVLASDVLNHLGGDQASLEYVETFAVDVPPRASGETH